MWSFLAPCAPTTGQKPLCSRSLVTLSRPPAPLQPLPFSAACAHTLSCLRTPLLTAAADPPAAARARQSGKTGVRGNRCRLVAALAGRSRTRAGRPAGSGRSRARACRPAGRSRVVGRSWAGAPSLSLCGEMERGMNQWVRRGLDGCRFSAHPACTCAHTPPIPALDLRSKNSAHLAAKWG